MNGNVELAGSSSIRFLINGKPSTAFGNSVADVLQSIPASQIKSIEVVTNPGAKYDAQGLGGIINIVLKQSNAQGINGNISLAAGTRADNGSFNFNARKGTFGVNAFMSGNYPPALDAPVTTNRMSLDTAAKTSGFLRNLPIGDGCDSVSFNSKAKLIFTPNGSDGNITVIKAESGNSYKVIGNYATKRGGRTITIHEKSETLFIPTADFDWTIF